MLGSTLPLSCITNSLTLGQGWGCFIGAGVGGGDGTHTGPKLVSLLP